MAIEPTEPPAFPELPLKPKIAQKDLSVIKEIEKLETSTENKVRNFIYLLISIGLFYGLGVFDRSGLDLVLIVVVLLIHEGGHFLGMRVFGYRDVRMLFIPFFGAAVSGTKTHAEGWKEAVVVLMGPLPGLGIGYALGGYYIFTPTPWVGKAALMFIFINGFNLLPFYPLDGGRFLQEVLFCRNSYVETLFRVLAGLALVGIGWALDAWILAGLGAIVMISASTAFKQNRLASRLKETMEVPTDASTKSIPEDLRVPIIKQARLAFPDFSKAKTIASVTRNVWERMLSRPPGVGATVILLALYGLSFCSLPMVFVVSALPGVNLFVSAEERDAQKSWAGYYAVGNQHLDKEEFQEAETQFRKAWALCDKLNEKDDRIAISMSRMGLVCLHLGRFQEALQYLDKNRIAIEKKWGVEGERFANAASLLGWVYLELKKYEMSKKFCAEAFKWDEVNVEPLEQGVTDNLFNYADACFNMKDYAQAEKFFNELLRRYEKKHGAMDVACGRVWLQLAHTFKESGNSIKAIQSYLKALEIFKVQSSNGDHDAVEEYAYCLNDMGDFYFEKGQSEEAEPFFTEGIKQFEKIRGKEHIDVGVNLLYLASVQIESEQFDLAAPLYERAIKIHEKCMGSNALQVADLLDEYAGILFKLKRKTEAEACLGRAEAIRRTQRVEK